jgi:hypothetical protein
MLAAVALACTPCHSTIVESYARTGMGRSFYTLTPQTRVEDFTRTNRFFHKPSQSWFILEQRESRFFMRREHVDAGALEKEIHFVLGSGNHARSYVHRTEQGRLLALPVSWYASEKGGYWAMAPGFDRPDHPHFRRRVGYDCFFCHNAYPRVPANADTAEPVYLEPMPQGIDCSRCHGSAEAHLAQPRRGNILNPRNLPPSRQMEVCFQCHLETTSHPLPFAVRLPNRHFFSYDPREPLASYMIHLDHEDRAPFNEKFEVVSAPYRLMQSACYRRSNGRLTCLTCHDPHGPTRNDQPCRDCHRQTHLNTAAATGNCISCHMSRRQPEDAPLTRFMDHKIAVRPETAPGPELPAYRGRPRVYWPPGFKGNVAVTPSPLEALRRAALERFPDLARIPDGDDALLLTVRGEALHRAGKLDEAERVTRAAIAADPDQPEPYVNLGALLASRGRTLEAERLFREALRIDPANKAARFNLNLAAAPTTRDSAAPPGARNPP